MPLGRAQHVDAAHVGHLDVGDQQVDRLALEQLDGRPAVLGQHHLVAFAPQHDRQQLPHRPLIVDDEDRAAAGAVGGRRWRGLGQASCRHSRPRRQPDRRPSCRRPAASSPGSRRCSRSRCDARWPGRGRCPWRTCRGTAGRGRRAPRRDADALVLDRDGHAAPRRRREAREAQRAAVGHRPQAVGRQVPDDLLDLALVGLVPDVRRPAGRRR